MSRPPSPAHQRDTESRPAPRLILIMGVSGCGKTSVGSRLAAELACRFVDADGYHPAANIEKMRAGRPLDDDDRAPWLDRLNALLRHSAARHESVVLACSALRARYRDRLADRLPGLAIVHLRGSAETISARLALRNHQYMPASLLQSQFEALEPPTDVVIDVEIDQSIDQIVSLLVRTFSPH